MSIFDETPIEIQWGNWYETINNEEIMPTSWNKKGKKGKILVGLNRNHKQVRISINKLI